MSCLYDVLNHVVLDAAINHYRSDERKLALAHLEKLEKIKTGKELLIMDRSYPSAELMKAVKEKGFKYLIRVNKDTFSREIRAAKEDCTLCNICS